MKPSKEDLQRWRNILLDQIRAGWGDNFQLSPKTALALLDLVEEQDFEIEHFKRLHDEVKDENKRLILNLEEHQGLVDKILWHEETLGGTPTYILDLAKKIKL